MRPVGADEERSWTRHLRLLPGGDSSAGAAIATTLVLYGVFLLFVGAPLALALGRTLGQQFDYGFLEGFSVANALPCFVIMAWTGLRVRATKPLAGDEAGVDLERRRVYFGDEVTRVPTAAVTFSIRPRQVTTKMADGRALTAFFRVNGDPEDLMALAREMRMHPGLAVEDFVHEALEKLTKELLPDPEGIREALCDDLLRRGVVITRAEVDAPA
jgi:hypothetical protein